MYPILLFYHVPLCHRIAVQKAPMERLVLETDAPYLAPEPYRGKRNASHYLKYVAEEIAALRNMTLEEVILVTEENGKRMYGIA